MPRLGHKKSRLGCRQCKARHVKCDELKPCSNCARHGVPCSLVTGDPNAPQSNPAAASTNANTSRRTGQAGSGVLKIEPTSTPSPSLNLDYVLNPSQGQAQGHQFVSGISEGSSPGSQSDHFPFLSRFVHQKEQSESTRWIRDLELLHHWTIGAPNDLTKRENVKQIMTVELPKQGLQHTYLMHELLAFAAFHKASELPEQRAEYYALGIHHQDHVIRGIRERLSNVTPEEAAPLFITSVYLTMTVFASTRFEVETPEMNNGQNSIDGILNIFHLLQGMGNVLALGREHVLGSFLYPMFTDQSDVQPSQPMLQELQQRLPEMMSFMDTIAIPELEKKSYTDAINAFQSALHISMEPRAIAREIRFIFYWPLNLHPGFFVFIRERRPGALIIIAFFATILVAAHTKHWFMQNWGNNLIRECYELLDDRCRTIVEWPISLTTHKSTLSIIQTDLFKAPGIQFGGVGSSSTLTPIPGVGDVPFRDYDQRVASQGSQGPSMSPPSVQGAPVTQDYYPNFYSMHQGPPPSSHGG